MTVLTTSPLNWFVQVYGRRLSTLVLTPPDASNSDFSDSFDDPDSEEGHRRAAMEFLRALRGHIRRPSVPDRLRRSPKGVPSA